MKKAQRGSGSRGLASLSADAGSNRLLSPDRGAVYATCLTVLTRPSVYVEHIRIPSVVSATGMQTLLELGLD